MFRVEMLPSNVDEHCSLNSLNATLDVIQEETQDENLDEIQERTHYKTRDWKCD